MNFSGTFNQKLGLVLSGGGARGAYEAGVMHYIRTKLPPEISYHRQFDVLCGSSVGAINICFLAATAHDLQDQGQRCYDLWKNLRQADVYKRDVLSLAALVTKSIMGVARNLFSRKRLQAKTPWQETKHFQGLLNTKPLIPYLNKIIPWKQISLNIKNNLLCAVSLTATNVATGKLELFAEKRPDLNYTGHYIFHETKLEYYHAMASAAIPLIFPTVRINRAHYMDGGLRLNTPMSPAIQLGAEKILVVGLHHEEERAECEGKGKNGELFAPQDAPPPMGMLLGKILSSIFLDKLDYDLEQMTRINRIIEWGEGCFGLDFRDRINDYLREKGIKGDIANRGLKKLSAMRIYPSQDLRAIFSECIEKDDFFSKGLTSMERTVLKLLDVDFDSGKDFLSFIIFHPHYLKSLLDLGFEDARTHHDELVAFMQD